MHQLLLRALFQCTAVACIPGVGGQEYAGISWYCSWVGPDRHAYSCLMDETGAIDAMLKFVCQYKDIQCGPCIHQCFSG